MTTFKQLQKNAEQLSERLRRKGLKSVATKCMAFFSVLPYSTEAAEQDAITIASFASSLDDEYDSLLSDYFNSKADLSSFKEQILTGIYLLKWFKYNSTLHYYFNSVLVDLFRSDLEISALQEIDRDKFNLCLDSLSEYCSYLYAQRERRTLNNFLIKRLGDQIQLEISNARDISLMSDSSIFKDLKTVLRMNA